MEIKSNWDRVAEHLHLTMAANWGIDSNAVRPRGHWSDIADEDKLSHWLKNCAQYLREQIQYAVGKEAYPSDAPSGKDMLGESVETTSL